MQLKHDNIYIDYTKTAQVVLFRKENPIVPKVVLAEGVKKTEATKTYVSNLQKLIKVAINKEKKTVSIYVGSVLLGEIQNYQKFGELDVKTGMYQQKTALIATEQRLLSQGKIENVGDLKVPFDRDDAIQTPKTDLHAHMSGCLTREDLREIALEPDGPTRAITEGVVGTFISSTREDLICSINWKNSS